MLTGCNEAGPTMVEGRAVSMRFDPNRVAGLPASDGASGPRDAEGSAAGRVRNTDDGRADRMALAAIEDIEDFWQHNYRAPLPGAFTPVSELVSVDPDVPSPLVCGEDARDWAPNALYCLRENSIAWDRVGVIPVAEKYFGELSVNAVLAHEYGHALQHGAGLVNQATPTLVSEQQADCFSGVYLRWVAEGNSPRFTMNTTTALDKVLAGAIFIRDPSPSFNPLGLFTTTEAHGTALDRVSALQQGFDVGTDACVGMDLDEIGQRRAGIPASLFSSTVPVQDMPITEQTLTTLMGVLGNVFTPPRPPQLKLRASCGSGPAVYCAKTNTVEVDLPALQQLSTPADEHEQVLLQGDDSAISIVTSRYALAVEDQRGVSIEGPTAALRTACLTGVAQSRMADPAVSNDQIVLAPGDLDKAVSGLLTNGIVATDASGHGVPSGFTRILAFRSGLPGQAETCYQRFR